MCQVPWLTGPGRYPRVAPELPMVKLSRAPPDHPRNPDPPDPPGDHPGGPSDPPGPPGDRPGRPVVDPAGDPEHEAARAVVQRADHPLVAGVAGVVPVVDHQQPGGALGLQVAAVGGGDAGVGELGPPLELGPGLLVPALDG